MSKLNFAGMFSILLILFSTLSVIFNFIQILNGSFCFSVTEDKRSFPIMKIGYLMITPSSDSYDSDIWGGYYSTTAKGLIDRTISGNTKACLYDNVNSQVRCSHVLNSKKSINRVFKVNNSFVLNINDRTKRDDFDLPYYLVSDYSGVSFQVAKNLSNYVYTTKIESIQYICQLNNNFYKVFSVFSLVFIVLTVAAQFVLNNAFNHLLNPYRSRWYLKPLLWWLIDINFSKFCSWTRNSPKIVVKGEQYVNIINDKDSSIFNSVNEFYEGYDQSLEMGELAISMNTIRINFDGTRTVEVLFHSHSEDYSYLGDVSDLQYKKISYLIECTRLKRNVYFNNVLSHIPEFEYIFQKILDGFSPELKTVCQQEFVDFSLGKVKIGVCLFSVRGVLSRNGINQFNLAKLIKHNELFFKGFKPDLLVQALKRKVVSPKWIKGVGNTEWKLYLSEIYRHLVPLLNIKVAPLKVREFCKTECISMTLKERISNETEIDVCDEKDKLLTKDNQERLSHLEEMWGKKDFSRSKNGGSDNEINSNVEELGKRSSFSATTFQTGQGWVSELDFDESLRIFKGTKEDLELLNKRPNKNLIDEEREGSYNIVFKDKMISSKELIDRGVDPKSILCCEKSGATHKSLVETSNSLEKCLDYKDALMKKATDLENMSLGLRTSEEANIEVFKKLSNKIFSEFTEVIDLTGPNKDINSFLDQYPKSALKKLKNAQHKIKSSVASPNYFLRNCIKNSERLVDNFRNYYSCLADLEVEYDKVCSESEVINDLKQACSKVVNYVQIVKFKPSYESEVSKAKIETLANDMCQRYISSKRGSAKNYASRKSEKAGKSKRGGRDNKPNESSALSIPNSASLIDEIRNNEEEMENFKNFNEIDIKLFNSSEKFQSLKRRVFFSKLISLSKLDINKRDRKNNFFSSMKALEGDNYSDTNSCNHSRSLNVLLKAKVRSLLITNNLCGVPLKSSFFSNVRGFLGYLDCLLLLNKALTVIDRGILVLDDEYMDRKNKLENNFKIIEEYLNKLETTFSR